MKKKFSFFTGLFSSLFYVDVGRKESVGYNIYKHKIKQTATRMRVSRFRSGFMTNTDIDFLEIYKRVDRICADIAMKEKVVNCDIGIKIILEYIDFE